MPGVLRLHNPMSALVWLALFAPVHFILPAAVCLIGAAALLTQPSSWETRGAARQAALWFFLLALLDAVSYAYSTAFNGIRTGPMDLWALSRPLLFGLFVVYLIRHYDASVRRSLETALTAAVYFTLFVRSIGARHLQLFDPVDLMGYIAALSVVYWLFFSQAPLRRLHAASAVLVVLICLPANLASSREAAACFWRSPVFGWGPGSYEPMSALGNQYLRWLLRNGALGGGLILIGSVLVCFRLLRATWHNHVRRTGAAIFLGLAALMLLGGAFLEDFRSFAVTSLLIACMHEDER